MAEELMVGPLPHLSDQRYYHFALMVPRSPQAQVEWLLGKIRNRFTTGDGRLSAIADLGDDPAMSRDTSFIVVHADEKYAGTEETRAQLEVSREELPGGSVRRVCAYDCMVTRHSVALPKSALGGMAERVESVWLFGSGYAGLTKHIVSTLVDEDGLLRRALFLTPKLEPIIAYCRDPIASSPALLSLTGIRTSAPGHDQVRNVRLSGPEILKSGLLDKIEDQLRRSAESGPSSEEKAKKQKKTRKKERAFLRPLSVRLRSRSRSANRSASFTLTKDGSCQLYMRKSATCLLPMLVGIAILAESGSFEVTANVPSWAKDDAL